MSSAASRAASGRRHERTRPPKCRQRRRLRAVPLDRRIRSIVRDGLALGQHADGAIAGIRFNHRSLAPVDLEPVQTAQWYESYWAFVHKAAENARQFELDMKPGDIVIFDNKRILHGRDAFSGASERLLYGCYSDRDGLLATLARLSNGVA